MKNVKTKKGIEEARAFYYRPVLAPFPPPPLSQQVGPPSLTLSESFFFLCRLYMQADWRGAAAK